MDNSPPSDASAIDPRADRGTVLHGTPHDELKVVLDDVFPALIAAVIGSVAWLVKSNLTNAAKHVMADG